MELFVPLEPVEVRVRSVVTATLPPYGLVGEAALLECLSSENGRAVLPSRSTIVAPPGVRFARIPHQAFYELQKEEGSDFSANVQIMIARTLSDKLKFARLQARETAVELDTMKDSVFNEIDVNGDGLLDRVEFGDFIAPEDETSPFGESIYPESEIALLRTELKKVRRELEDCKCQQRSARKIRERRRKGRRLGGGGTGYT